MARAQAAAQRAQQAATPINPATTKPHAPAAAPFATAHAAAASPAGSAATPVTASAAPSKTPTLEQLAATVASLQETVAMHAAAHEAQVASMSDITAALATSRAKFNELAKLMKTLTEVLPDAGTLVDAEDQLQLQMQQQTTKKKGKYMQRKPTAASVPASVMDADPFPDGFEHDDPSAPFPDVRSDDGSDPLLRATRKTHRDDSGGDEVRYAEPREPRSLIARRRPRLMDRGGSLISAK